MVDDAHHHHGSASNNPRQLQEGDMNFDEIMVHALVMPDDYRTESPTASPPAQGAAQRSPEANNNDLEGHGSSRDTDSGKFEAEICTSEVCFLGKSKDPNDIVA